MICVPFGNASEQLFVLNFFEPLQQQLTRHLWIGFSAGETRHLAHHPLEDGLFAGQVGSHLFRVIVQNLGHNPFQVAFVGDLRKVLRLYNSLGSLAGGEHLLQHQLGAVFVDGPPGNQVNQLSQIHSRNRQLLEVKPQFIDVAQEFAADPIIDGFGRTLDRETVFSK